MAKKPGSIDVKVRMTRDIHRKIQKEAERRGQTLNAEILKRLDDSFEIKKLLDKVSDHLQKSAASFGRVIEDVETIERREPWFIEKLSRRFNLPADEVKSGLDSAWEEHVQEAKNERLSKQKETERDKADD